MLRGLTTVNHFAADVPAAVRWYTEVFGVQPYFEKDFGGQLAYVEFRIGDYQHEFGILDSRYAPHPMSETPSGTMTYWAVDNVEDAFARLLALGATEHAKPTEHGPGFVTASVVDPFGNVLGVMFNQHYLDTVSRIKGE
ncbi:MULTISPECIES: VOC family protein [unclassified Nocardia]|uniref:VOC family protein n=1 Tax=unclassified Nocardia TaxID=2637762 RepID=UPI00278C875C|nr:MULTISPECIES: VOC family protein [unclassified Nocardia]